MVRLNRDGVLTVAAFCLLLFIVAEVQVWHSNAKLAEVKSILTDRCEKRQAGERDTADDLHARIRLYATTIEIETTNRFIDEPTRAKRVKAYTEAMAQAQVRLAGLPAPVNCSVVYAEGR